jgi:hypothetical protein
LEPSVKVTVPVGEPRLELTVAVRVTFWPYEEGFKLEVWLTMEGAGEICCRTGGETTPEWPESPLYVPVIA